MTTDEVGFDSVSPKVLIVDLINIEVDNRYKYR